MPVDVKDLFREFPEPPEDFTTHIRVLSEERLYTSTHELHDAKVLEELDQERSKRMKQPTKREDYIALVRLVATTFGSFEKNGTLDVSMEDIEAKYGSDKTTPEVWADFKRLVDTCLAERKFKMIRYLHEFWYGLGDDDLRWWQITNYPGSIEQCRAEKEEMLKQQEIAKNSG